MLKINGHDVQINEGQSILELAMSLGIDIPSLCHDQNVKPQGNCGICVVEIEAADGKKLLRRACSTAAMPGMIIETESPRVQNARKTLLELMLSNHTGDCLAPCILACPAQTDCQGYVTLIAQGKYKEAAALTREKLPLPSSIGRICPHPCEKECRRKLAEEPVSIAALKYFASDKDLPEPTLPTISESTGKSVAIIGGGPAGLTTAYFLRLKGHKVSIYDAMPQMGGMLRYGIPEYRLPKKILDAELKLFEDLGILFKNNIRAGKDISLADLRVQYNSVIVAVGAWKSMPMGCLGEDEFAKGGIEFLRQPFDIKDKQVAVVGGGFTAMDVARTAIRLGASQVSMVYRRTQSEMPAADEYEDALEEGVIIRFLEAPLEVLADGLRVQKMKLGEPDASGRRSPVVLEGQEEIIPADVVIRAIGQNLDMTGLEDIKLNSWGAVEENNFQTNLPGVFAIGDAINRGGIAIEAIGHAQRAVPIIDNYLMGQEFIKTEQILVKDIKTEADFADRPKQPRHKVAHLNPAIRTKNFKEVSLGLTEEQAIAEAKRCLACGCSDYFECKLLKYSQKYQASPTAYINPVKTKLPMDTSNPQIDHDHNKCILCSLCVRGCEEVVGKGKLSMAHRGYPTIVTNTYAEIGADIDACKDCYECVKLCPTGALSRKLAEV